MLFVCHPKILHKHCLQFLLGVKMAPRETENNAYAKFWGDKQRALWYVMVFSGVVNEDRAFQNKVNELMQKCEQNPSDKGILNELYATKLRLQTIMRQKTKGAILRSKARWHEYGERNYHIKNSHNVQTS